MSYGDDGINAAFLFEPTSGDICALDGVLVNHARARVRGYQTFGRYVDADEADAAIAILTYLKALEQAFEGREAQVVVGAKACCFALADERGERVNAVVKLVVADDANVISQGVHQLLLQMAVVKVEV